MPKQVLDVGQCQPDHQTICNYLAEHFDVEVTQTHALDDTLAALRGQAFDLVLVNRKLDQDYSDGIEIIKAIKADASLADVPVMLITNYDEHHDAAVALGAERGFGKLAYGQPETRERLARLLA